MECKETLFRLEEDWQNYLENKGKLTYEDIVLIKKVLEKEIPKKINVENVKLNWNVCNHIPYVKVKICPKCNRKFDYRDMLVNYCSNCGQHLDWSELENE